MDLIKLTDHTDIYKYKDEIDNLLMVISQEFVTSKVEVTSNHSYHRRGDIYQLFSELKIPKEYWYLNLRLNGLREPTDWDGTDRTITVCIDEGVISLLKQANQIVTVH